MHEEPTAITSQELRACLQDQYGLQPASIGFLSLSNDPLAAVYRVVDDKRGAYFLKLKSGAIYPASCHVPRFLDDIGLESVVAPLHAKSKALWTHLNGWSVVLYPHIEGNTGWDTITPGHWTAAGRIFRRIHEVPIPAPGFEDIRRESYDPSGYATSIEGLEAKLGHSLRGDADTRRLGAAWSGQAQWIQAMLTSLYKLGGALQSQSLPLVICHADLHPGNLLRTLSGEVFVVDWDDVMLAPIERDFIFVGEPADPPRGLPNSPFFEGYGPLDVNWLAVTYFRYERVVQDLIVNADTVLNEELPRETRTQSLAWFAGSLKGRNFGAAQVAAGHIPPDLAVQLGD